jgi:hypothetical protein
MASNGIVNDFLFLLYLSVKVGMKNCSVVYLMILCLTQLWIDNVRIRVNCRKREIACHRGVWEPLNCVCEDKGHPKKS